MGSIEPDSPSVTDERQKQARPLIPNGELILARKSKIKVSDTRTPTIPNEDLIRETIIRHKLLDSDDNEMILDLLLHQEHNLDAVVDAVARKNLCAKRGWSEPTENDRIEFCLKAAGNGETVRKIQFRRCVSENLKKLVAQKEYHTLRRTRLMEQIRKCRGQIMRAQIKAEKAQSFVEDCGDAGATDWSEIDSKPLPRISTGIPSFDAIFGVTPEHVCEETGKNVPEKWGPVVGKVYALAAEQGMGKTRLMVKVLKKMCGPRARTEGDNAQWYGGNQGVYFQAESNKGDFVSTFVRNVWVEGETKVSIAGDTLLEAHERIVREVKPQVVIIDSKDMLYEFKTGSLLENAIKMYRNWAAEVGFVLIIISHVNKEGKLKGRTEFGHAVDAVLCGARSDHDDDLFSLMFTKNRMGKIKKEAWFKHTPTTVEEWDSSLIKTEINPNLAILLDEVDPRNEEDDDNRLVKVN
jgi:KaiC/GvpD/RAD55 family RecA-like ATPase